MVVTRVGTVDQDVEVTGNGSVTRTVVEVSQATQTEVVQGSKLTVMGVSNVYGGRTMTHGGMHWTVTSVSSQRSSP